MMTDELAERRDVLTRQEFENRLREFRVELRTDIEQLVDARCTRVEATLMRWMLTFFVPLWLGTWGTIAAVLLKG